MQQISVMDYIPWCGDDQKLAGPSDHIPNPPILTGMTYNVRPIHCSSPSDFVVRNWDREGEYAQLKKELSDIYQEKPRWLTNTVNFNFKVANMRGETFFGDGVSRRDGLSLVCWLVLMGRAVQRRGNPIAYAHVEGEWYIHINYIFFLIYFKINKKFFFFAKLRKS